MTDTVATGIERRTRRRGVALFGLIVLTVLVALLCISIGAYRIDLMQIVQGLILGGTERADIVIAQVRLPRILFGLLVGAALGGSGAALQVLFRNPLADPGLIGISSGAALGAIGAIVLGSTLAPTLVAYIHLYAVPAFAFAGAGIATVAIVALGSRSGRIDVAMMLLVGIAINAIAFAGIGILSYLADDQQLRSLTFWTMGSLAIAGWDMLPFLALAILCPLILLALRAADLNRYLLGEVEAAHLGLDVKRMKRVIVLAVALSVGAAVSFAGSIGFIGLVVPHLVRIMAGADNRIVIPGSMLAGAILISLADLVARTIVAPAELPVGLILGAVGGPFFLWLLITSRWRSA